MKKMQSPARRLIAKLYRAPDGTEPVDEFIEKQKQAVQLAIDRQIDRINALDEEHLNLAFPYSQFVLGPDSWAAARRYRQMAPLAATRRVYTLVRQADGRAT
jgi:hypothetical protein